MLEDTALGGHWWRGPQTKRSENDTVRADACPYATMKSFPLRL